ncbi:PilW family protein [Variovorax rhizosphaerae]|uniref:Prepilin-type N-terminal cleavage/methylation domain-containing protein n=1 Tax=Variovorax rhizosphaerae TaxID=1836200 RepID=A0ABU8WSI4_9BURK
MSSRSLLAHPRAAARRSQRGVTLVELLAALVIGLLVIGAAIAAMLLSRNSAAMVTDVARLQQQGSYVLRLIGMQARQAGSLNLTKSFTEDKRAFNADFKGYNKSGFAVHGLEGANGYPDTVSFSTQAVDPDDGAAIPTAKGAEDAETEAGAVVNLEQRDCLANTAHDSRLDSTFFVDVKDKGEPGETRALKCSGLTDSQPIVTNAFFADLQVWYRVKASPTTIRRMDANEVQAANLWNSVSSVEICLDLKGTETTGEQPSRNYVNCNGEDAPHNGVLHMLFRNVFDLRTQQGVS